MMPVVGTFFLPTLIIVACQDGFYPDNALIFEHLGTPDRFPVRLACHPHVR